MFTGINFIILLVNWLINVICSINKNYFKHKFLFRTLINLNFPLSNMSKLKMINFFKSTMSGIAQVIVQPCSLSGLIILASIAIHSWKMALGAFFGAVIGTASAKNSQL